MDDHAIKVMIVDDEHLVRNLLKKCIDWNSIGMEIVAEASSGEDALDLVDEIQPDLIFTDICMTDIDGIEFSDIIIKKYPNIKVVVLTGYQDFKYAQRSIKAGIKDYLLKPIDDEVVLSTALELKELILEERSSIIEYNSLKKQIAENLPFLKERLFNMIIQPELDIQMVNELMESMNFSFSYDEFQTVVIEIIFKPINNQIKDEEKVNFETEVLNMTKEYFKENKNIYVFFDMNYRITIINNSEEDILEDVLENIEENILSNSEYYYCIGVGRRKYGLGNIEKSYQESLESLNYRIIVGKNSIIKYENINFPCEIDENMTLEINNKLKIYLLSESKMKIKEIIENTFIEKEKIMSLPKSKIKEFLVRFASIILETLQEIDIDVKELHSEKYDMFEELFMLETIPEIEEYLEKISFKTIEIINQHKDKKSNKLIDDIKEYVKLHLADSELSLLKVSEKFFINSSYLSRLFKKEMGLNFMEFVTKLRIDKAMMLLRNTDLKAYEIGEQVGFPDSSYFSTCFKRYTGVSVSEYKKN